MSPNRYSPDHQDGFSGGVPPDYVAEFPHGGYEVSPQVGSAVPPCATTWVPAHASPTAFTYGCPAVWSPVGQQVDTAVETSGCTDVRTAAVDQSLLLWHGRVNGRV